jgi:hypothetical protein
MHVKEDRRKEFNDIFRQAGNFFKHGDRDPHSILEFSPGFTYIFIYFALYGLELCGESPLDEFRVFQNWLQIHHPEFLPDDVRQKITKGARVDAFAQLQSLPKHEFFEVSMRTLRAIQT